MGLEKKKQHGLADRLVAIKRHVHDLARACVLLLEQYDSPEIVNIGVGEDITIRELAELICDILDYRGRLVFDSTKPDGTPRKLLDVAKINALGWSPKIPLREGIAQTYQWYLHTSEKREVTV